MKTSKLNLANTVQQYKIINYIYDSFNPELLENEKIKLIILDRNCIQVMDQNHDSIRFYYDNEKKEIYYKRKLRL